MTLDRAIEIAREAHAGQVDRGGHPYIEHCLRVMDAMETDNQKIVAVLHDLIEDVRRRTVAQYLPEFPEKLLRVLRTLSRGRARSYREYIGRIACDELARRVKIADLKDNLDLSRIPNRTAKDLGRVKKYKIALAFLEMEQ